MSAWVPRCGLALLFAVRSALRAVGSHSHFSPSLCRATATKEPDGNSRLHEQKMDCFMFVLTSEEFSHCASHQNLSPTLLRHSLSSAKAGPHIIFPSLKHALSSIFNHSSCFDLLLSWKTAHSSFFFFLTFSVSLKDKCFIPQQQQL